MTRPKSISLISVLVFVTVSVSVAYTVKGQSENPGSPNLPVGVSKQNDPSRAPSIRERQMKMLEMEREAANPRPLNPEQEKLAMAQIAEDFRQIQVINNKMMSVAMSSRELNFANIAETTSEIKNRAVRLRENLMLAKPDPKDKSDDKRELPTDAAKFKTELLSLDKSIMSFVESPIFKTPAVVDLEDAAKARRDLETIIDLSSLISKTAGRLKKTSRASQ